MHGTLQSFKARTNFVHRMVLAKIDLVARIIF